MASIGDMDNNVRQVNVLDVLDPRVALLLEGDCCTPRRGKDGSLSMLHVSTRNRSIGLMPA